MLIYGLAPRHLHHIGATDVDIATNYIHALFGTLHNKMNIKIYINYTGSVVNSSTTDPAWYAKPVQVSLLLYWKRK